MMPAEDNKRYDNAIEFIKAKWESNDQVFTLAKQMETLGKNMRHLRGSKDPDDRKKMRVVWQRAIQQYWDLVWAIVEAKIDDGPPQELTFDKAERLLIDFGHLYSEYTTENDAFFDQLDETASVDMYQYNRLTDYIRENYALIFGKPYTGTSSGISIEDKKKRFTQELEQTKKRRRMVLMTLNKQYELLSPDDLDDMLKSLEEGLVDMTETEMRTRRIREAEEAQRKIIREHCRKYEAASTKLDMQLELLEKKLTKQDKEEKEAEAAEAAAEAAGEPVPEAPKEEVFDPFAEITDEKPKKKPEPKPEPEIEPEPVDTGDHISPAEQAADIEDSEETAESINERAAREAAAETIDQSLKIIENVRALHDRTRFLAGMIIHVQNEGDRWERRVEMAKKKYKGQGVPALKMELREGLNNKKDFMMLCARSARIDVSPLCQNKNKPMSLKDVGAIMMDLTPLDPDMLRAARIRMYGIPRVIVVPGQGLGVYDWSDNSLIIPIFPVVSGVKDVSYALAAFRWDNDEDRTLKDTYSTLKQNKGKGIVGLQNQFYNDYFLWISMERKGYRKLNKEVSKWFKAAFKQSTGGK